jgi:hypothetical protein
MYPLVFLQGWAKEVLDVCEAGMHRAAASVSRDDMLRQCDSICRCLFIVGEVAVLGLEDSREGVKPATAGVFRASLSNND